MANDLLSNLSDVLSQQFSLGGNKLKTLDVVQDGHVQRYGKLGDFAKQIDQSAEREYVEEGFQKFDPFNQKPKQLDILMQDPDATILIKKRMFSSLAENYRFDLMDARERLFVKATKVLFQNKCRKLSAYEQLTKIARITNEIGRVDYNLLPILFSATDTLTQLPGAASGLPGLSGANDLQNSINNALSGFKGIVDRVREVVALSQDAKFTTWITIPDSFRSSFGEGTGVIELTNMMSFSTTTSLKFAQGRFNASFSDPYNLMLISNLDIEQAISDATNQFYNNSFIQLGLTSLDDTIALKKRQLNLLRTSRRVNPITFLVIPNTFLGKRVRAIIDNIGFEIIFDGSAIGNIIGTDNIDPSAKIGSAAVGEDGLNDQEASIFNDVVSSIFTQMSLIETTRRQAKFNNQDPENNLNAVRKQMRLHYGNKLIIQPMDSVHIYIDSKKKLDSKITGGLQNNFNSLNFLQGTGTLLRDIKDLFNVYNGFSVEKSIFVGDDFPNWLWLAMRSLFVSDKNGAHVFAGVVETSTSSYRDGVFTADVSGSDNAAYFKYGVVNFKPAVDVFNGVLFDPLTPFRLEFDSVTGIPKDQSPRLLQENEDLFSSAFVKDKNGIFSGAKITTDNYLYQDADRVKNNDVRRVFYDPDGMVYRWKEGIATLRLFGDTFTNTPVGNQAPAITADPFAGQDVMNVLSLLITGQPYNFSTFYKAATKFDTFKKDSSSNEPPSISYFRGLQSQLKEQNALYGNFIPFKSLVMDEATFAGVLGNQLNAVAFDAQLQDLIKQRAELGDKFAFISSGTNTPQDQDIQVGLKNLDTQIQQKIADITNELNNTSNPPITIVGDDISFDYEINDTFGGSKTRLSDDVRKELRKKINFLTRRLAWKVRNNEDPNFLIVDDTYDKDYDIQAFEKSFVNPQLFKSEYATVADKIESVVGIINGMEVFANTQGHIEIRNPKYNRVPSSVFYRMFRLKDEMGIQIFPQFLEDLFVNQVQQLFTQIEVLEDEIRLYCLALGKITDSDCIVLINSFDQGAFAPGGFSLRNTGGFIFLSDPDTGKMSGSLEILKLMAQPDVLNDLVQTELSLVQTQVDFNGLTTVARAKFVQSVVPIGDSSNAQKFGNLAAIKSLAGERKRENDIVARLQNKTGQQFDLTQLFTSKTVSGVDVLNIVNGIAARLSTRQTAIKSAANALKNIQESVSLFNGSGGTGSNTTVNTLLFPDLNPSRSIPKVFEHMIEDESYDDLGVGSSSRYVIKNRDVISDAITEQRPPWTYIEVTGRLGDQFIKNTELPSDLNVFAQGNALVTAAAIDYDMWRMYGLTVPQSLDAPYLTNPDTQCPAFAVSLLNKARKQIFTGRIEIVGNEFQQPGEVIYLEHRDQLFYIDSITHNFTYNQNFSTSLEVSYGHNPGEYIPTWLDVIGKVLYRNKDIPYVHKRQGNVFNQEHLGVIVGNYNQPAFTIGNSSVDDDIIAGPYGDVNRLNLQKIIEHGLSVLALDSDTMHPSLELRVYYNSDVADFNAPAPYALSIASSVKDYLIGAKDFSSNAQPIGSSKPNTQRLGAFKALIPDPTTIVVNASQKNTTENRAPSVKAMGFARDIAGKVAAQSSNSSSNASQSNIDSAIYNFIVDCWVVFQNPQSS